MSSLNRSIKLGVVTALIPVVFACELLLPQHTLLPFGVGEALGCSGGGNVPTPVDGWKWLAPVRVSAVDFTAEIPVATDGFFALRAEVSGLTLEQTRASLELEVTDEEGEPIDGELALLSEGEDGAYLFGWSAQAPLEDGARLRVSLTGTPEAHPGSPGVGGEFRLRVGGAPTEVTDPDFSFLNWLDFYHGVEGEELTCASSPFGSCGGPKTLSVPASIEKQIAGEVQWLPPAVAGNVAWTVRVETARGESDARVLDPKPSEFFGEGPEGSGIVLGRLAFPTPADEHCATVIVKDLRTGDELRTERCEEPRAPQRSETDTQLQLCDEPPNLALRGPWCMLNPSKDATTCADFPYPNQGASGSGGSGSEAGGGAGRASSGSGEARIKMNFDKRSLKLGAVAALIPIVFAAELLLPEHAGLHLGVRDASAAEARHNRVLR